MPSIASVFDREGSNHACTVSLAPTVTYIGVRSEVGTNATMNPLTSTEAGY